MVGRIHEKRDNNPHQREVGEVEDKDQRDRRAAQRDVEVEEADRSRIVDGRRKGGRDTEDTMTANNGDECGGNPGKNLYQRRRGEKRESRLPDNNAKKIDRLDRTEAKSASIDISRKMAKRLEVELDENGRSDRQGNPENAIVRRDRVKEGGTNKDGTTEEGETVRLSKNKELKSKKTTHLLDDAEKGCFIVNKEVKFFTNDEEDKGESTDRRFNLEKVTENYPSNPIEYQLSNAHFVKLGWTVLPITKTMRKIVRYEARPAKPNLDWFKKYRHKDTEYYDNGSTPFLKFHRDGSGELFYPNSVMAIKVHRPENREYDMYTVFTPGGKDILGIERESQILAIFDTMGYGVVFDMNGAPRLSYNQIGGIFTDNPAGLPLVWTWNVDSKKSTLETVHTRKPIDQLQMEYFPGTSKLTKSPGNVKTPILPSSSRNKEKKVVELQEPVVEKRQEEVGSKLNDPKFPKERIYHIKVICMKLNDFLGLRIIDRRNIGLRFSAKKKSIRIELGTILNFNKEVASHMIEANDWRSDMLRCRFQENLSKKLESDSSLYDLAKEYQKVKRIAKERKIKIAKYKPFSKINHAFKRSCKVKTYI